MKTVNSISGGKTSAYMTVHYPADYEIFSLVCIDDKRCSPKDRAIVNYVNKKLAYYAPQYGEFIATAEDDRTIVAMMDLEQFIGRDIIWVRGASFDDVIDRKHLNVDKNYYTRLPSRISRYCTDQMKIFPIFDWWFRNLGDKIKMNIGFRFDEYDRVERFFNREDNFRYSIPVLCSLKGKRLQKYDTFDWRFCSFPLVKNGITKRDVDDFWRTKGYLLGNLFTPARRIEFPVISNCVGCFHKKPDTLAIMYSLHPEKMDWFSAQEEKGMGTWLDSKIKYQLFKQMESWSEDMIKQEGAQCDSGGCTD